MLWIGFQSAGTDDDHVCRGTQQPHDHAILAAEATDVAAAAVTSRL
jgi:hypothetical protein